MLLLLYPLTPHSSNNSFCVIDFGEMFPVTVGHEIALAARVGAFFDGDVVEVGPPEPAVLLFVPRKGRDFVSSKAGDVPLFVIGDERLVPLHIADDERLVAVPVGEMTCNELNDIVVRLDLCIKEFLIIIRIYNREPYKLKHAFRFSADFLENVLQVVYNGIPVEEGDARPKFEAFDQIS